MMVSSRDDEAVTLLERLLALSERNPGRARPAALTPDYANFATAELVRRFEERMALAERVGAVEIRKGKRERRHIIERVTVVDLSALTRHLGRDTAETRAQEMHRLLVPIADKGAPWVRKVLDEMGSRWARGGPAFRLGLEDESAATEFISLLAAISTDRARGLDGRTFSQRTVGDSKALDRHAARIAWILSGQLGLGAPDAEEVWAKIGLERFAHPVHLKGSVCVRREGETIVDGRIAPFASVHPEWAQHLELHKQPAALLTVENFASFNRQVREINDGSLVVYTGGFASAGVIRVLKSILELLDASVLFFHWGDIDPGGLRIFRFLEESLPRPPKPHLMERCLAEQRGHPADPDPSLRGIGASDSNVAALARWLASGDGVWNLEQEALDPVSPHAQG